MSTRNITVSYLYHTASFLMAPAAFGHIWLYRIILPFKKGKYGQSKNKNLEILQRIFLAIVLIPLSLVGAIFVVLGIAVKLLAGTLQKEPFTYLKGSARDKKSKKKFSLFSLNVCFIAGGYPLSKGGVMPWRKRIKGIVDLIRKKNTDIVCLQEMYDVQGAYNIYNCLKKQYSHCYLNIGPHLQIGANSGLFVLSKFKIINPKFVSFDKKTLFNNYFVNKGFFSFEIFSNGKSLVYIYNTHLQYSENDNRPTLQESNCRKQQIKKIYKNILKRGLKDIPCILTGDLNMELNEFKKILAVNFYKVSLNKKTAATNFLIKHLWSNTKPKKEMVTLDYTLLKKDSKRFFQLKTEIISTFSLDKPDKALSDHQALLSFIYF